MEPYFTLQDLASRWECYPEAIVKVHDDLPAPDHPYGWCVETILMHEMQTGPQWPLCIATLDTAKQIGLENEALEMYKALIYGHLFQWFFQSDDYAEALAIYKTAIGVKE